MTNSRKPQSEKLATGGGRGTTAVKPEETTKSQAHTTNGGCSEAGPSAWGGTRSARRQASETGIQHARRHVGVRIYGLFAVGRCI